MSEEFRKSWWMVEHKDKHGKIFTTNVFAENVVEAIERFKHTPQVGVYFYPNSILGVRKI